MRNWILNGLLALSATVFGLVLTMLVTEGVVRLYGHRAWAYEPGTALGRAIVFEATPQFGWWAKPGHYVLPPYAPTTEPVEITIREDRTRITGAPMDENPELVTVGCSFTFGWAVSDHEAYPYRLQQQRPERRVLNLGTPGYGTYQSLLRLEDILKRGIKPKRVLYGYIHGHEHRNIAHPLWLYSLEKYSNQGMVAQPYGSLDAKGQLVRHAPEAFPQLPLRNWLASVVLVELRGSIWLARERIAQQPETTDRLILDMAQLCRAHDVEFSMVLLTAEPADRERYTNLTRENGLHLIDCALALTPDAVVPRDGHPNGASHAKYAECIDEALATAPPSTARMVAR